LPTAVPASSYIDYPETIDTSICTHLSELGTKENSYKKKNKKKRKQANVSNNNNTLVKTI